MFHTQSIPAKIVSRVLELTLVLWFTCLFFTHAESLKNLFVNTLLFWFHQLLPCQFFMIVLLGFFKKTGIVTFLQKTVARILCPFIGGSETNVFLLLLGFLFGFPSAAIMMPMLYSEEEQNCYENKLLLTTCHVLSPAYIITYLYPRFEKEFLAVHLSLSKILFLYYGIPLIYYMIMIRTKPNRHKKASTEPSMQSSDKFPCNKETLSETLENTLAKLSLIILYMLFFSSLQIYTILMPIKLRCVLNAILEVSSGMEQLIPISVPLGLSVLAFGGCSCAAQLSIPLGKSFDIFFIISRRFFLAVCTYLIAKFMLVQ